MIKEKTLLSNAGIIRANKQSRVLDSKKGRAKKEISVIYECVGTAEENQEILDRVFDRIFNKVLEKRQGKKGY
jgi:hypothetical protein